MPVKIKAKVPKRPIKTPAICRLVIMALNKAIPTIVVKSGTAELKMEVTPLSSSVCAKANKNGGKNELKNPAMKIHFQSLKVSIRKLRYPTINKKVDAKTIRKLPNCKAVKPNSDLFINIKEEPQTKESIMR